MQLPTPGQTFQRKYKLQEVLGRGGFAVVYRATDIEIGRDLAIKVLDPGEDGYSPSVVSRFNREARVIAGLHDPHTITMFDFGRSEEGLLYMVFEFVNGVDLSKVIARMGRLDEATSVHILEQILQSLREAHAAGILHRDIKPDNILVYPYMDDPFRVKVLDFGIAKPVATADSGGINITRDGAIVGTPRYMAPEQIYGGELTPSSDLYSLGLVAHEMLTGAPAIKGVTSKDTLRAQLSEAPVTLPRLEGVSAELRRIVDKMTSREPEGRYHSADEVMRALEFVVGDDTERMAAPPLGGGAVPAAVAPYAKPALLPRSGDRTVTATSDAAGPATLDSPRRGVSTIATVALGLAFGAGLVGAMMLIRSVAANDEPVAPIVRTAPIRQSPTAQFRPRERPAFAEVPEVRTESDKVRTESDEGRPGRAEALPKAVDAGANDATAAEIDAAPRPAPTGCGVEPAWSGEKYLFVDKGLSRRFWMAYVPKNYRKNRKHRVVLMFHKRTKTGVDFFHYADFQKVADRENLVVLAPDGSNAADPWIDPSDVPFMHDMLEETGRVLCLDRSRVYAIGHGSGGEFARKLACEMPLSALGLTGFGLRKSQEFCETELPVPTIYLSGKTDRYIPFDGGKSCLGNRYQPVAAVEAEFRQRNECSDSRRRYLSKKSGNCYTWRCDAPFVSCHLNGGHDWSNAPTEMFEFPGCHTPAAKFPHRDVIWKFLETKGRRLED